MKNIFFIITLSLSCSTQAATDFMQTCLGKNRPKGFDELVKASTHSLRESLGSSKVCKKIHQRVLESEAIHVNFPIESPLLFEMFPNANFLDITLEENLKDPPLKPLPLETQKKIRTLVLEGNLQILDLGDIPLCRNLQFVTLLGNGKDSWVDAKALSQLPLLDLEIGKLTLKNAKALENLKDLKKIYLKEVKLDEPINWSSFPNLKSKKLVGVVKLEK